MRLINTSVLAFAVVCSISTVHAFPAQFGLAPDNNRALLTSVFASARKSILINIYQFDNTAVVDALIEKIDAGVRVEILLEGEPLGNISAEGKKVMSRLRRALSNGNRGNHFFLMTKAASGERRYRYNHAKYVVVDDSRVLISSENFTENGHAAPGMTGNRGWETVLDELSFASEMTELFRIDSDLRAGDVIELRTTDLLPPPSARTEGGLRMSASSPRAVPAIPVATGEVRHATLIVSPDANPGLHDVTSSATRTLVAQHMSLPSLWKEAGNIVYRSPLVEDLIQAAKRGVAVRVILNDDGVFDGTIGMPPSPDRKLRPNETTAYLLEDVRRCYGYTIAGRIIGIRAAGISYVHNKGMSVDSERALVSSINGTRNSVMNNREVAVLLESRDAATYFARAFDFDWSKSAPLPEIHRAGTLLGVTECPTDPVPLHTAIGF